jgi:hypothetical protein
MTAVTARTRGAGPHSPTSGRRPCRAALEFDPAKTLLEEMRQSLSSRKNPNQEMGYNEAAGFLEPGQKDYAEAL